MEEKEKVPVEAETSDAPKKNELIIGEKGFSIVLFLLGCAALALSLELWSRMSAPKISSAAGIPVIVTVVWTVLALWGIIDNRKYKNPLQDVKGFGEKAKRVIEYVMPLDVFVTIVGILAYCILLYCKISFYIVTPLFLYGLMCYLARGKFVKNVLWTAVVMAFIYVVFRLLFNVIFP